jgi:Multicopper oxidase
VAHKKFAYRDLDQPDHFAHHVQRAIPRATASVQGRQRAIADVYNHTGTPEQLHWHGQKVPVDGAAEEGTPFIPAHGMWRLAFIPKPAGFRFYHTHSRAGANLAGGMGWALSSNTRAARESRNRPRQRRTRWSYARFAKPGASPPAVDQTFPMTSPIYKVVDAT